MCEFDLIWKFVTQKWKQFEEMTNKKEKELEILPFIFISNDICAINIVICI